MGLIRIFKEMFAKNTDVAIDLGTSNVSVYQKGKGVILKEPSAIAINCDDNSICAVGKEAYDMFGRTHDNIRAVRPLKNGIIFDYTSTEKMIAYFLHKATKTKFIKPRVVLCIPSGTTGVERKAFLAAAYFANARQVFLIEEPVAVALGSNVDISRAHGTMVVDVGGGTSNVAIVSLGSDVISRSIKVGGDSFDDAIVKYVKKRYNVIIGDITAEDIKIKIGSVYPKETEGQMNVKGRSLTTGFPENVIVSSIEIRSCMVEIAMHIVNMIHSTFEEAPPELVGDVLEDGIILSGGGSGLFGLDKLISKELSIGTRILDNSKDSVILGAGKVVENLMQLKKIGALDMLLK